MHVTFESNIVLLCKLDTYNAQVRPNLLYLVVETWVIMFIVAEKVRGSRPGCLAWQVKMMAQTKTDTLVLQVWGWAWGLRPTSCKTLLFRNLNGYCCPEDGSHEPRHLFLNISVVLIQGIERNWKALLKRNGFCSVTNLNKAAESKQQKWMVWDEIFELLWCFATYIGSNLPMFWEKLSVRSQRVKQSTR